MPILSLVNHGNLRCRSKTMTLSIVIGVNVETGVRLKGSYEVRISGFPLYTRN